MRLFATMRDLALRAAAVLAALVVATFLLLHLMPGDPARRVAGVEATQADIAALREEFGLDLPLWQQFARYAGQLARGDLGRSFVTREPVTRIIAARLPNTLHLAGTALALMLIIALPLGLATAAATWGDRNRPIDLGFTVLASVMGALPGFLVATFLVFVFAIWLRLLPVAGAGRWDSVILPALAVGLRPMAELARITRVETLGVLAQDYVRTGRAKRLGPIRLYGLHVLPNVMTAVLTVSGMVFANLIGGAVVVENIFAWPGLGTTLVQSILTRDYPVIQGIVLLLGCAVVVINLGVDLALVVVDPRAGRR